ncbi:MAG: hypothetical protein K6B46_05315 [Opitutales bacterium]|nr:hypothetical protein [Opitutales bacterium]
MKKTLLFLLAILTLCGSACLYTPETTYTYWRYNERSGFYSPVRSEYPIDDIALKEEGLVAEIPQDAKTTEPR